MSALLLAVTQTATPDDTSVTVPTTTPDVVASGSQSTFGGVREVFTGLIDALGDNGYQTGTALIVATVALVALLNLGTQKAAAAAVTIGAFWAGWLGWNTVTSSNNQLFPGDVQATKLWDVAFTSDIGFLVVAAVSCVIAALVWRKGVNVPGRAIMVVGGVLGASLVYNLFESVVASTNA